jgi:ribA/ribD-fused uncharacterized protein
MAEEAQAEPVKAILFSLRKHHSKYACFDPWFPQKFIFDGQEFKFIRAAFWYSEAMWAADHSKHPDCTDNYHVAEMIRKAPTDEAAITWYKKVVRYDDETSSIKFKDQLLHDILWARFAKDKPALELLRRSYGRPLAYASTRDFSWGTGADDRTTDPEFFEGKNLYGRALMNFRKAYEKHLSKYGVTLGE